MSVTFNNILAVLNISLLIVITIAGFVYGSFSNLTKTPYTNGFEGIVQSASIVIYAVTGFESSTYAINEAKKPSRNVPLSMIISLSIISFCYCGSSFALNMMQPFDEFDLHASYPTAFKNVKFMYWVYYVFYF